MNKNFGEQKQSLKEIRNKLLKLHKILLDNDRQNYEREFGALSSGKFLEMLLSDERFEWLRKISTLIVRIDEAFALNDGMDQEMLDVFYKESFDLLGEESSEHVEFKEKLNAVLPNLPEALKLKIEINEFLK